MGGCTMRMKVVAAMIAVLACSLCAPAKTKQADTSCKTTFSVVTRDELGNLKQGLSEKQLNEIAKKLAKKYPAVCYVPPAPTVSLVFLVTISTATYHGTRTETNTSSPDVPEHGAVTDEYSQPIGSYDGTATQTTTTESTVPVQFEYPLAILSIEQAQTDGTYKVLHRFQRKGLCPAYAGLCVANRHPFESLIEDGAKWIYEGGLHDPLQSVASPN
jgi:hypothetical protein